MWNLFTARSLQFCNDSAIASLYRHANFVTWYKGLNFGGFLYVYGQRIVVG